MWQTDEVYDKDEQDGEKERVWKMSLQNKRCGRLAQFPSYMYFSDNGHLFL